MTRMPAAELRPTAWSFGRHRMPLGRRTLVMGVVNVTPDSFSDGGRFLDPKAAMDHGRALLEEGADMIDVGGESTRPGSEPVPPQAELRRVLPALRGLRQVTDRPLSVDTHRAEVAAQALQAGADLVNDVSALSDPAMAGVVRKADAGIILMHMQGRPKTMQEAPAYRDVVGEVRAFLAARRDQALAAGIPREAIAVDPGLGFGKRTGAGIEDNAALLRHLDRLLDLGQPLVVGASRKTFIGNILKAPVTDRIEGSLAAAAVAAWQGAHMVRVHDVHATRRVVDLVDAVRHA